MVYDVSGLRFFGPPSRQDREVAKVVEREVHREERGLSVPLRSKPFILVVIPLSFIEGHLESNHCPV